MDRNIQSDLELYRKQKAQNSVVPSNTPTIKRNISADLEAYRIQKAKPKTYEEKSAEMQSQGQAVATKGRFNRTGQIAPSFGGQIVRGIAKIPVEGALTVARGFGGLVNKDIREEGLTVKSKFLGDTKDYATSVQDTAESLADRVNKGEISKGRAVLGVLGASAEKTLDLASVIPAGTALSAGKTALKQGAKGIARERLIPATKTALKRSGSLAGGYDIASQAKEGEGYNPLRTVGAVALGTVADVGVSNVLPRVVSPRRKTVDEEIRKIFEGTTGDVAKVENSAFRAKKGLELLIKESKDIEIPDSNSALGSGATKSFDIKKSSPNELLSGVLELDKKITARARQATESARNAGLRVDTIEAEVLVQKLIDNGEVPKASGQRILTQIRNANGDPVKIHDWIQDVNVKYKKKYERGTIEDTLTGKTADDVAEVLRGKLDSIVDRKGYAEAFGNNQELKRMLVAIAKKANKKVNFGDISTEAGLDAAISILTANPAYMARTVGTTLFKGLLGRIRNKSGLKALNRAIKKQSKLPTKQRLPSDEVKPQTPLLQLPAGKKDAPKIKLESGKTINLPTRVQSTIDKEEVARLSTKYKPSNLGVEIKQPDIKRKIDEFGTPLIYKNNNSLPSLADPKSGDVFYHGTSAENKKSILKNGINTKLNKRNSSEQPEAFYISNKTEAEVYGKDLVGIRLKKGEKLKVLDFATQEWNDTVGKSMSKKETAEGLQELRKRGYDAINNGDEIEILNPKKFEVFEVNKSPKNKLPNNPSVGKTDLTSSISKAKASGQSFDEWVKGEQEKSGRVDKGSTPTLIFAEKRGATFEDLYNVSPERLKGRTGFDTPPKTVKVYRGVKDPSQEISLGDYVTTDKNYAKQYGEYIKEMELPASELRYMWGSAKGNQVGEFPEYIYFKTRSQLKAEWDKIPSKTNNKFPKRK